MQFFRVIKNKKLYCTIATNFLHKILLSELFFTTILFPNLIKNKPTNGARRQMLISLLCPEHLLLLNVPFRQLRLLVLNPTCEMFRHGLQGFHEVHFGQFSG